MNEAILNELLAELQQLRNEEAELWRRDLVVGVSAERTIAQLHTRREEIQKRIERLIASTNAPAVK